MIEPFPILEVRSDTRSDVEQLGSKPKFWFKHEGKNWLFKEARINTGEDWAEKVASEIAALLGLPTHHTELAVWEGKYGCAVRSFLDPSRSVLVHGNELLGGMITGYDKEKQWRQSDHTFDNIVAVIEKLFPTDKSRTAAASRMVGYLVLDALIGNTDRHHQNWGAVVRIRKLPDKSASFVLELAPTFDHASSLGRELTDDARIRYLRGGTLERYIRKAHGGIFEGSTAKNGMSPMALAEMLAQRFPEFFKSWQTRVSDLQDAALVELLQRIPDSRISQVGRDFALALLLANRHLIKEAL